MDEGSGPAPVAGAALSFEAEAQAAQAGARKRYWRAIWTFVFGFALVTVVLAVTANAFYRLSVARTLYWPASLAMPAMNFDESDPLLAAYVARDACEDPAGDEGFDEVDSDAACAILALLARGEAVEAVEAVKQVQGLDADGAHELLPSVKATIAHQLEDAARRRDWATCALMAWVALQTLDKQDSPPQGGQPADNRLLLLASSCQLARLAYLAEADYVDLTGRIAAGTHLDADYIAGLIQLPARQLQAWGHYLDAIAKLRAREAAAAAAAFQACLAAKPAGALRELALLGKARALFWQYTLAALDPSAPRAPPASEVRADLRAVAQELKRASFRHDVDHYLREVR